jgi:hypothetical protein
MGRRKPTENPSANEEKSTNLKKDFGRRLRKSLQPPF